MQLQHWTKRLSFIAYFVRANARCLEVKHTYIYESKRDSLQLASERAAFLVFSSANYVWRWSCLALANKQNNKAETQNSSNQTQPAAPVRTCNSARAPDIEAATAAAGPTTVVDWLPMCTFAMHVRKFTCCALSPSQSQHQRRLFRCACWQTSVSNVWKTNALKWVVAHCIHVPVVNHLYTFVLLPIEVSFFGAIRTTCAIVWQLVSSS